MLEREWRKGNLLTLLVGMKTSTATMEDSVEIPLRTANRSAIWPSNPTAGHTHQETRIERDTCTPVFIAALFIIAGTWKQPRCPLTDEWIRKLWYIYTMEYYSAIKKNAFESILMKWMKLEPIIQTEVSQKEKYLYSILTYIYGIRKMVTTILYARQQKGHRYKEQTFGLCGRRRGWDDLRK